MTRIGPGPGDRLPPVGQVLDELLSGVDALPAELVPLAAAAGRVSAVDVTATTDLPRFDNAAMDGVAVRAADTAGASDAHPARLTLVDGVWAGGPGPVRVEPGTAAPIGTGAPLPEGADAVVRIERTTPADGAVLVHTDVRRGRDVRRRGEDLRAGNVVLPAGRVIGPAQLAAIAGSGNAELGVHRRPRVGIVLTGDEVVPPGAELGPAQVHDAIGPALLALARDAGACAGEPIGPVRDDVDALVAAIDGASRDRDVVLTVGGVSKGGRDHLPEVVGRLGEVRSSQVALRPAKPFLWGRVNDAVVLGLPGNPAAALVAFEVFARPVLAALQARPSAPPLPAVLQEELRQTPGRLHYVRARVSEGGGRRRVWPAGEQGAAMLHSLAGADAWLVVPPEVDHLPAGSTVAVRPIWGDAGRASWSS